MVLPGLLGQAPQVRRAGWQAAGGFGLTGELLAELLASSAAENALGRDRSPFICTSLDVRFRNRRLSRRRLAHIC